MTTEREALERLQADGILELVKWATHTVFERVGQDYDEAAGHDQAIVGLHAYKYFIDLLDRATSCGRFKLPDGEVRLDGDDILRAGISEETFSSMPTLHPDLVNRRDFNGSPAWAIGPYRFVLQSFPYGGVDQIGWSAKSPTKVAIAGQAVTFEHTPLFELLDMGLDEPEAVQLDNFVGATLVLAHSFNRETGAFEVYLGLSRLPGYRGDGPWQWRRLIVGGGATPGSSLRTNSGPILPGMPPTPSADDAEVRLRRSPSEQTSAGGS